MRGKQGCFIQISLDEVFGFPNMTSPFGGYDVRGIAEIKSGNYYVKGELWFTTGETYEFYNQLVKCWAELKGLATFCSTEANLELKVKFINRRQISIVGYFKEFAHQDNEMKFEIESEQSFFGETVEGLEEIVNHHGGLKGIQHEC
ncbi:hypothetical protein AB4Z50_19515 [Paenibacillus sp. 2TAB26]|uniref:WapI family immunity protein n=1 Tax=Paenibacillus sp. 2TAB26 TaxID=3233005 RepID=UPI003F967679